jgi:spore germination protein YaaH
VPGTTSSFDEPLTAEHPDSPTRPPRQLPPWATRRNLVLAAVVLLALLIVVVGTRDGGEQHTPTPDPPGRPVAGWFPYWVGAWAPETTPFAANQAYIDAVSPFWYQAGESGSTDPTLLKASTSDGSPMPAEMVDQLRAAGVPVVPSVVDAFDAGGMAAILADPATRAAHVDALVELAAREEWDGIDLDYERFAFADGADSWDATRPNWVAFVQELSTRLHTDGRQLVVTTPALWQSDGKVQYRVYDWESIAPHVDTLRVMTYDWSTSQPGPLAPAHWVEDTLDYATEAGVPPGKLQLGIPTYGKDWITSTAGTCPPGVPVESSSVPLKEIDVLIAEVNATPSRDESSGEMTFTYTSTPTGAAADGSQTSCTQTHEVWYLDQTAIGERARMAAEHGSGVALWALGYEPEWAWEAIRAAYPPPTPAIAQTTATVSPTVAPAP